MVRSISPYGTWPSPVTAASLVEQSVRLSEVTVRGDRVYWVEGRPTEGGREVLVCQVRGGRAADVLPNEFSARTQVHEYGGRCYDVQELPGEHDLLVFSNWGDQRLWALGPGG